MIKTVNDKKLIKLILSGYLFAAMLLLLGCQEPPVQVDFKRLPEVKTQNLYIVCPPKYCNLKPNEISPVFPFDQNHLNVHWQAVVKHLPRLTLIAEDKEKLLFTYVQRTKYLHLPEVINVQLIPMDKNHSTLAIYSQSKYGFSDFGANKARVDEWLQKMIDSVGTDHKLEHR